MEVVAAVIEEIEREIERVKNYLEFLIKLRDAVKEKAQEIEQKIEKIIRLKVEAPYSTAITIIDSEFLSIIAENFEDLVPETLRSIENLRKIFKHRIDRLLCHLY